MENEREETQGKETRLADEKAEETADKEFGVLSAAMGAAVFYWLMRQGHSRVNEYLSEATGGFNRAIETTIESIANESVTRSFIAFTRANPGIPISVRDTHLAHEIARLRALPDQWGLTFGQRVDRHYRSATDSIRRFVAASDIANRNAILMIPGLARPGDRNAFVRRMRNIESSVRRAIRESPIDRANVVAVVREIRRFAAQNPGQAIPTRMIRRLQSRLDEGFRSSVQRGVASRTERLHRNLSNLTRNVSNSIFQTATIQWMQNNPSTEAMKWNLSPSHKVIDMCDDLAMADAGMGPGIYYVGYAPWPAHANCLCFLTEVRGRFGGRQAPTNPNAERERIQNLIDPQGE